jgi:hypothetical protein
MDLFSDGGTEQGDPPEPVSSRSAVHATQKVLLKRLFWRNSDFNRNSDLHDSGLPLAGFLGWCRGSSEHEIGQPVASVGRIPDLRRRNWHEGEGIDGDAEYQNALGG